MDIMLVLNSLYNAVEKYPASVKQGIYSKISMWLNEFLLGYWRLDDKDRCKTESHLRENKHILKAATKTGNIKYTVEGYTLLINIKLGLLLYKLLKR